MDQTSWDKHGLKLSVELSKLNSRLATLGFKKEEMNLPSQNKLVSPWEIGLKARREIQHWDHTSYLAVEFDMEYQEPRLDLVLRLKVLLDSERWQEERPEKETFFMCYESVAEDVWRTVQDDIKLMEKRSLEGAFELSRWIRELKFRLEMGLVSGLKILPCLKIINEFEKKGSLNNSSMEFIDEVLKKRRRRSRRPRLN
jgi:hypothetical protein